jgi:serine/threonine-protein kinase RsbW
VNEPLDMEPAVVAAIEDDPAELYENAPCGYLSTLPDGTVVKVNQTFLTWTGYRRADLVGRRRFHRLLTPGGQIFFETHFAPLLAMQGAVREIALDLVGGDGRRLPVLVNATVKRDADGRPLANRITVFDATDRRRYERELLRARREAEVYAGRMGVLQRVTAELAGASSVGGVAAVIRAAGDAVGAVDTALCVLDAYGGGLEPVEPAGRPDPPPARPPASGPSPYADAMATGAPIVIESPERAAERYPEIASALTGAGRHAMVVSPFGPGGQPAGLVAFWFGAGTPFGTELPLLRILTDLAGQAVERARLYEETEKRARRAGILARLSRELDEIPGSVERTRRCVALLVEELAAFACLQTVSAPSGRVCAPAEPPAQGEPDVLAALRPGSPVLARVSAGGPAHLVPGSPTDGTTPTPSWVALPLVARGRGLGALVVLARRDRPFRDEDLPFLSDIAERVALAVENARLYEQERDSAVTLQRSLLAGDLPRDPRFELVTRYRPAVEWLEVGGDWYDAFPIGGDKLGVVVGDVVGRGIRAASTMGQLRSALRAVAGADLGPARLIEQLDLFVERLPDGRVTTLAYVEAELTTGRLRFACAGHPPPIVLEPGGTPRLLWSGRSLPLGPWGLAEPRPQDEVVLPPGSRLLLYSDGLVERPGEPIDDGLARLVAALADRRDAPLAAMVDGVLETLLGDEPRHDDMCLLALSMSRPDAA